MSGGEESQQLKRGSQAAGCLWRPCRSPHLFGPIAIAYSDFLLAGPSLAKFLGLHKPLLCQHLNRWVAHHGIKEFSCPDSVRPETNSAVAEVASCWELRRVCVSGALESICRSHDLKQPWCHWALSRCCKCCLPCGTLRPPKGVWLFFSELQWSKPSCFNMFQLFTSHVTSGDYVTMSFQYRL